MTTATYQAGADVAHGHHDDEHPPPVVWSARMPIGLMGMFFFIGSEIALFGSFFMLYFFIRVSRLADYSSWAEQMGHAIPLDVATVNSLILFSSSVTIHYATIALKRNARGWLPVWVFLTLALGLTFLTIQILEYGNLIGDEKIGPSTSAYSSVFFSLTGLHGSHVFVGAILLTILLVRSLRGHYGVAADQHVGFEAMSVYWHFVDAVWIFVFGLIYLPGNIGHWEDMPLFVGGVVAILVAMFALPGLVGKGAPKGAH